MLCCAVCSLDVQGDPYKTLFVSRLSYDVTERKLRHEFEEYGPIKRIRLVHTIDSGGTAALPAGQHWHQNSSTSYMEWNGVIEVLDPTAPVLTCWPRQTLCCT